MVVSGGVCGGEWWQVAAVAVNLRKAASAHKASEAGQHS